MTLNTVTLPTGRTLIDPLSILGGSTRLVSESGSEPTLVSTSAAMINDRPDICPKCKNGMSLSRLPHASGGRVYTAGSGSGESVYFCAACRVTHPLKDA